MSDSYYTIADGKDIDEITPQVIMVFEHSTRSRAIFRIVSKKDFGTRAPTLSPCTWDVLKEMDVFKDTRWTIKKIPPEDVEKEIFLLNL